MGGSSGFIQVLGHGNAIGSWKLAPPGKVNQPGTGDRRNGPGRNGITLIAEGRGHAATGRTGGSSEIFLALPVPERGRCRAEHTGPPAGSRIPGFRGGD
jgi:hypothetical protein